MDNASEKNKASAEKVALKKAPRQFFMTLRDISFWIRSAKADHRLSILTKEGSLESAFDQLYREKEDPYGAAIPYYRYQRLKYQRLLALLPQQKYGSVLDVGCGLGVFTREIAPFADRVLGVDFSSAAVDQARILSKNCPNIEYRQGDVMHLEKSISETFDLIMLADVLYYLSPLSDEILKAVRARVTEMLNPGGLLLLVNHSFFYIDPDSKTTRGIHSCFSQGEELTLIKERWHPFFLASVLQKS